VSTRLAKRLAEPDYWTCPHGNHVRPEPFLTYGPEVADLCARADFEPDAQQELGLDLIFAIRPDGSPASFAGCVICCRQNLKTGLFKQAAIGWMFVTEEPTMVWSAHEMSTTTDAQRDLENLITSKPFLSKELAPGITNGIFYGSLGQRIEFKTGQQILFKARTNSGGRGLARRKLILDEAFALTKAMMGAVMPVLMAQENAQVLYGSSAGKADSEVLLDVRERGRHGKSPRLFYLEWLAPKEDCADAECEHPKDALDSDVDCALDREHLLRKANPALSTGRITLERLRDLRQEMPPEEYARECLGWWDEPDEVAVSADYFTATDWAETAQDVHPTGAPMFFITVAKGQQSAFVAVAANHGIVPHIGVADWRPGVSWLTARIKDLHERHPEAKFGAYSAGPVKSWAPQFAEFGVELSLLTAPDAALAYAHLKKLVDAKAVTHSPAEVLSDSLKGAVWKEAEGGGFALDWRKSTGDPAPFAAAAGASWLLESIPQHSDPGVYVF
jgi:hypothetical protein